MKTVLILTSLLLLTSCFKTAEEIAREKRIDDQMDQSSRIIAELSSQVTELKGRLASTSGQIEEIDYKNQQSNEQRAQNVSETINQLTEQVKILTETNLTTQKELKALKKELKSQKRFMRKVTGTLSQMGGAPSQGGKSLLRMAHNAFEKNKQKKAKELYLQVLTEGKINNAKKNHVYYNLGLLEYWNKKYNDSLVYFSKIYTKYPKSKFAPGSLLYIGRSFKNINKSDEANASFSELIKNYPKSKQAKLAIKELAK